MQTTIVKQYSNLFYTHVMGTEINKDIKTYLDDDHSSGVDEVDFLILREREILNKRDFYQWRAGNSKECKSQAPVNNELSTRSSEKDATKEIDELLPDLDLMGLFDESEDSEDAETDQFAELHDALLKGETVDVSDVLDVPCLEQETDSELNDGEDEKLLEEEEYIFSNFEDEIEDEDNTDSQSTDIDDWNFIDSEVDEFDPEFRLDLDNIEIGGRLTREERAYQKAAELGVLYALNQHEVNVLGDIFCENGWAQCKEAIIRELDNGTSIDEIELASQIKLLWFEHHEFYSGQESNFRVLSWPTALKLISQFRGLPSIEEVEQLLVALYHHWMDSPVQKALNSTFNKYLIVSLNFAIDEFDFSQEWQIALDGYGMEEMYLPISATDIPAIHDYELNRALRMKRRTDTALIGGFHI